jgi:hypothetical protein
MKMIKKVSQKKKNLINNLKKKNSLSDFLISLNKGDSINSWKNPPEKKNPLNQGPLLLKN